MILVRDITFPLSYKEEDCLIKIAKHLRVSKDNIKSYEYYRKSLDLRDKDNIFFVISFVVDITNTKKVHLGKKDKYIDYQKVHPLIKKEKLSLDYSPVVVGFGPCGLFLSLYLARKGLKPIAIEQGGAIDKRDKDVEEFLKSGKLNHWSNVQFGEGGAGTYSDGKLTTSVNSELVRLILEEFVFHGAPKEITYLAKPHIGTDCLRNVVKNIREEIVSLGGQVFFDHQLVDIKVQDGQIKSALVQNKDGVIEISTATIFLALGHSARETFKWLYEKGIRMEKKAFAMGVRVEHYQKTIDEIQYGKFINHPALQPADYKIITHLDNGRTVYSFCMCPGGEVICASSEEGCLVVNGMSNYKRDSKYANAALLVNVNKEDIPGDSPLAGLDFQKEYEKKAFEIAKEYRSIAQHIPDFLEGNKSLEINRDYSYKRGLIAGDISTYLPDFVSASLKEGLLKIGKIMPRYIADEGLLIGLESRSSSPLRILRDDDYLAIGYSGLYPCGEGAGYAGGIVTAALDGIKVAQSFCKKIGNVLK